MTILVKVFAGAVAGLLAALGVLLVINANLRADLATAKANVTMLGSVNADLKDKADKQNHAIAVLQAEDKVRARRATQAVKAAGVTVKRYKAEAALIGKQPVLRGDDCASATQILRDYLAGGGR